MIALDFAQNSPEWYAARRGIPTASEFGRIITPKTGKYASAADAYIAELIAESVTDDEPSFQGNQWMERGASLETEARDWYAFQYDVEIQQVGLILNDDMTAGASPDGLIGDDCGLEIKCPAPKTHISYLMAGTLPDEYKAQVHGNMLLSGRDSWVFLSYYGPELEPLVLTVERDDYTDALADCLDKFIARLAECRERFLR